MVGNKCWDEIQAELADIPGEKGVALRAEAYAPFFLRFGAGVRIEEGCRFHRPEGIVLDDDVRINVGTLVYGSGGVHFGRHCRVGPRCFIHSANHDTAPSSEALFERGYAYHPVIIGDNCLLSANVSLLPGAELGAGTFVACGAVVLSGQYGDESFLAGTSATTRQRPGPPDWTESPTIALMARADSPELDAARLLVTALGLPQVRVCEHNATLPASVVAVLDLHPGDGPQTDRPTWAMHQPDAILSGEAEILFPGRAEQAAQKLPDVRSHLFFPPVPDGADAGLRAGVQTMRTALRRVEKGAAQNPHEVRVLLWVLSRCADAGLVRAGQRVEQGLGLKHPSAGWTKRSLSRSMLDAFYAGRRLKNVAMTVLTSGLPGGPAVAARLFRSQYPQHHELAFAVSLHSRALLQRIWADRGRALLKAPRASVLAWYGLAAALHGNDAIVADILDRLLAPDMCDPASGHVRNQPGKDSYCYSPVLAALFAVTVLKEQDATTASLQPVGIPQRKWSVFADDHSQWRVRTPEGDGAWLVPEQRLVSRSLLDNWLGAMTAVSLENGSYELGPDSYAPDCQILEDGWFAVFLAMAEETGTTLVRVRPWPADYSAALSLTLDVDRNTTAEQARSILDMQRRACNSACASWYFIPGETHSPAVSEIARRSLQERGVHALGVGGQAGGQGVTFHSGLRSDFWQGEKSVRWLEDTDALYGEMMSSQIGRPRPVWLENPKGGRMSRVWLLPVRFPLEGSTSETTLEYFDRLGTSFDRLLQSGGHAVVVSHPDLEHGLIEALTGRLDMARLWCAPVARVVDRCRALFEYGAVSAVHDPDGGMALVSRRSVADVRVEIHVPGQGRPSQRTVQLCAGWPRTVWESGRD